MKHLHILPIGVGLLVVAGFAAVVLLLPVYYDGNDNAAEESSTNYANTDFDTDNSTPIEVDENSVQVKGWKFAVDTKTEWDYVNFKDDLILRITSENGTGNNQSVASSTDIAGYQNGQRLEVARGRDYKADPFANESAIKEKVSPGNTFEYDWGWELLDYSPVEVTFAAQGDETKSETIELVPEMSKTAHECASGITTAELEERSLCTGALMKNLEVKKPEGWYIDDVMVGTATVVHNEDQSKRLCVMSSPDLEKTEEFMKPYQPVQPAPAEGQPVPEPARLPVDNVAGLNWMHAVNEDGNLVASVDAVLEDGSVATYRVYGSNVSFDEIRPVLECFRVGSSIS